MNAMDKLFKLLLAAAAALFFTGCYSDYLNPGPARVYTRADFEAKGLEYISVGELKARFRAENAGMNDGTVASWTVDEPLFTSGKVLAAETCSAGLAGSSSGRSGILAKASSFCASL